MGHFFHSVCVFDYRGFCKNGSDCFKKHFQEICKNRSCVGESCLKRHPKNCIFFSTFGDCKFAEFCRYHHEEKNTCDMIELKDLIKQVETLKAEITIFKVENVGKENKLKEIKKISEDNVKLRKENENLNKDNEMFKERLSTTIQESRFSCYQCDETFDLESKLKGNITIQHKEDNVQLRKKNKELNCVINIFRKRLSYSKDKKVHICTYQCCKCNFESEGMEELKEHMTDEHEEIRKESYVESGVIAVESCCICQTVFYSREDLEKHIQLEIQCSMCEVCTTVGRSELDYCAALEHFGSLFEDAKEKL